MIVVHRDVFERCGDLLALDKEKGYEVRALLAMALAIGGGCIHRAAQMLHSATSIAQYNAGEDVEQVVSDTREMFAMCVAADADDKGVVFS